MVKAMKIEEVEFAEDILKYVDQMKDLLSPKLWQNILLDCSKNEILTLWLLYRKREVNMTQVADYIHVPLNTATGVISRMEKKCLVLRERSAEDKRVVTLRLGELGEEQIKSILDELLYYGKKVLEAFSVEEMELFYHMMNKLMEIMKEDRTQEKIGKKIRRIVIE